MSSLLAAAEVPILWSIGFMGATRRMLHYDDPTWQPYMVAALLGAGLILCGVICQAVGHRVRAWWKPA